MALPRTASEDDLKKHSLKTIVQQKIRNEVIHAVNVDEEDLWKVLVVDDTALHILSTCFRMSEVIQEGVTVVEGINKLRKKIPDFHALYLCLPTEENIKRIVSDIKPKLLYRAVHIFFLTPCPEPLIKELASPRIIKHIKTLKEVNVFFKPAEARVFTLDRPDGLYSCYSPHAGPLDTDNIATQLLTLCESLSEQPIVRCSSSGDSRVQDLAARLQQKIDSLTLREHKKHKQPSQVLLLDRGFDLMSPLAHELTYQAACFDLLDVKNGRYSFQYRDGAGREARKQVSLDESDELWVRFRHHHISEVFREVTQQFKAFSDQAKQTQGLPRSEGVEGTKALKEMLKALPQHREKTQMFSVHIDMSTAINKAFSPAVENCTRAEQNMMCQEEADGSPVRDFIGEISPVLIDRAVTIEDKLRCAMLCVIAKRGTSKRELDNLLDNASIPEPRRSAINNLSHLGAVVTADKSKKSKKGPKRKKREPTYNLSRWTPVLKDLMEDVCDGTLPTSEFTAIRSPESVVKKTHRRRGDDDDDDDDDDEDNVQSSRGQWAQGKNTKRGQRKLPAPKAKNTDRPRLIVFVLGAISYPEMRAAYEVADAAGWDVYIGSHSILAPTDFVEAVEGLDKPRAERTEPAVVRPASEEEGGLTFVAGSSTAVASV